MQRLIETEEKGRGLALFGWAGVTTFAFLAAFAAWQFAPGRSTVRIARAQEASTGDITGGIRNMAPRYGQTGSVPTVPTPLPAESSASPSDLEQIRNDIKELRRVVGRIDATSDVLARRISNLEDAISSGAVSSLRRDDKPLQPLVPIPPTASMAPAGAAQPMPPPIVQPPAVAPQQQRPQPTPQTPSSVPASKVPEAASIVPQQRPQPQARSEAMVRPEPPRPAVDKAELERMLLQSATRPDSDSNDNIGLIPPMPDPVSMIPKSHAPMPLPTVNRERPKPAPETTASIPDRPVLPIDSSKAVSVAKPAANTDAAKAEPPKPDAAKPTEVAVNTPPAAPAPAEKFGFDLGGYKSINQVRKVWTDLEIRHEKLTKAMVPLAKLGEARDGVDIRLIGGPFTDKEAAKRACEAIRGNAAKCDLIAYSGEPIVKKEGAEPAKPVAPAAKPRRAPTQHNTQHSAPPLRLSPTSVAPPQP